VGRFFRRLLYPLRAIKCGASLENVSAENRWRTLALAGAAYLALLRLVYLGQAELLPEEAYYWNYAKHLDFGYLDHPPMVAWLIGAGTWLLAITNSASALARGSAGSSRLSLHFGSRGTCSVRPRLWCALLLVSALPFFFGVAFIIAPDSPLTACWAAALFFLERALVAQTTRRVARRWDRHGLGMLSKYSIGLVGLAAGLFLLVDASSRRWFLRWEPYAATLLAFALFSPVILWNAQHDWASFSYQAGRRGCRPAILNGRVDPLHRCPTHADGTRWFADLCFPEKCRYRGPCATDPFHESLYGGPVRSVLPFFSLRHAIKLWWTGPIWLAALPALALGPLAGSSTHERSMGTRVVAADRDDVRAGV